MTTEIYRKYIDIINENSQPDMLTEGMLDSIVQKAKSAMSKLSPKLVNSTSELVSKALGKSPQELSMADLTMSNIKKVIAAAKGGPVNEEWEREPIPGSLGKDRAAAAGYGAVFGAIGPLLIVGGAPLTLPVLAVIAGTCIVIALLAASVAQGERGMTGVLKTDDGKKSYYPKMRDPRLPPKA